MQRQGGGAYGAPLSYLDTSYREPQASAGSDILRFQPGLARPVINPTGGRRRSRRRASTRRNRSRRNRRNAMARTRRGGFYPSVMGSFTANGAALVPATLYSGYKFIKNYKGRKASTRRRRS
jgi:hypothetical protein